MPSWLTDALAGLIAGLARSQPGMVALPPLLPLGSWPAAATPAMPSAHSSGALARAIPAKRNEAALACPSWIHQNRNRVERLWARLKEWRAVATRHEKAACSFVGVLCMAATMDWTK